MAIIGIDLGTTNSLVAFWDQTSAKIIPNALGDNLTPSVVSVDENGQIFVGKIAKERLITHPELTAAVFKRFMGTEKKYQMGKFVFTPVELSSFVIKALKEDAQIYLKTEIKEAVISVPAYFNDAQRTATKKAAEMAGLKVERLINEPTAAAISYGLHKKDQDLKILVFDLGGGTFDVSILEFFEGIMEVKSIAGDNFLGGEDFTEILFQDFLKFHKIDKENLSKNEIYILYKQSENCKLELASKNEGNMKININSGTFEKVVTRNDFEKLSQELILKLRKPIEKALKDADIRPSELDAVVLIGGATRMQVVRSTVSKMFGKIPFSDINPDESVAFGTAIQAALKERNEALEDVVLTDVCPYSLGTNVVNLLSNGNMEGGYFMPIIERNTTIPVSKTERLCAVNDFQKVINLEIYQGENIRVSDNVKLGEISLKIPPAKAGEELIEVRYTYDINGILEVEVTVVSTGKKERMVIEKNPGMFSKEDIEKRLKELSKLKIHPRDKEENKLLLSRCERIYRESLGERREYIASLIREFESVLSYQDDKKAKVFAKELKLILDNFEGVDYF